MGDWMTRPVHSHAYAARPPVGGPGAHSAAVVHRDEPGGPVRGSTPVTSGMSAAWSADGAPFYNTGYVYPVYGPLITGGALALSPPAQAAQIDLTDMTTWDRPVIFPDAH